MLRPYRTLIGGRRKWRQPLIYHIFTPKSVVPRSFPPPSPPPFPTRYQGVPLRYHVPPDTFAPGVWSTAGGKALASWPSVVPGWFNVDLQPSNRAVFRRQTDEIGSDIAIVADLVSVVKARKQALDGGEDEQRSCLALKRPA